MTLSEEDKAFLSHYRVTPSTNKNREVSDGSRTVNTNQTKKSNYAEVGKEFIDNAIAGYTKVKISDIPKKQRR